MEFLGRLACKLSQVVRASHVVAKSLPVSFSLKDARGNVIDGRKTTPGDRRLSDITSAVTSILDFTSW